MHIGNFHFIFRSLVLAGVVACVSGCSSLSHVGPSAGESGDSTRRHSFVKISSIDQIPELPEERRMLRKPKADPSRQYSETIEPRDILALLIIDVSSESIFYNQGSPYQYGPVVVPDSGLLKIPFIGEVDTRGKTQSQLADSIGKTIGKLSGSAEVAVQRTERLSKRASVLGEVQQPGPYHLDRRGITLFDLVAAAGGTSRPGYIYTYTLFRGTDQFVYNNSELQKIAVLAEDGDILVIEPDPERAFYVLGTVRRPGSVPFPSSRPTLSDALSAGAGLDINASKANTIFIFRPSAQGKRSVCYGINFRKANCFALADRFQITGRDVVYVSEAGLSAWGRIMRSILPFGQVVDTSSRLAN